MPDDDYELAMILSTDDPGTLYSGLSVLISAAVDGGRCAALAAFGGLSLMLSQNFDIDRRESWAPFAGDREKFWRSLYQLREAVVQSENIKIWACSASLEVSPVAGGIPFDGIMSTPRFLRETAGARRLIHV